MIISDKLKCIYIHPRKTAGISICDALIQLDPKIKYYICKIYFTLW